MATGLWLVLKVLINRDKSLRSASFDVPCSQVNDPSLPEGGQLICSIHVQNNVNCTLFRPAT
jgi:hypothetical protein|tara:strand:+ start:263 stop:448 length:186 start_codon:yes stop_codon:yes gene_type:complete